MKNKNNDSSNNQSHYYSILIPERRFNQSVIDLLGIVNSGEVGDIVTRRSPITYSRRSIVPSLKFS